MSLSLVLPKNNERLPGTGNLANPQTWAFFCVGLVPLFFFDTFPTLFNFNPNHAPYQRVVPVLFPAAAAGNTQLQQRNLIIIAFANN